MRELCGITCEIDLPVTVDPVLIRINNFHFCHRVFENSFSFSGHNHRCVVIVCTKFLFNSSRHCVSFVIPYALRECCAT